MAWVQEEEEEWSRREEARTTETEGDVQGRVDMRLQQVHGTIALAGGRATRWSSWQSAVTLSLSLFSLSPTALRVLLGSIVGD